MPREVYRQTKSYTVYTQEMEGELHIHCDVALWGPSVLKALYRDFVELKRWGKERGYGEMFSISPNPKFCEVFCAESIGTYNDCEVMRWDLR